MPTSSRSATSDPSARPRSASFRASTGTTRSRTPSSARHPATEKAAKALAFFVEMIDDMSVDEMMAGAKLPPPQLASDANPNNARMREIYGGDGEALRAIELLYSPSP